MEHDLEHDLTQETRRAIFESYRAHCRRRLFAQLGCVVLFAMCCVAIGALAASQPSIASIMALASVVVWGLWSIHFLLCRN